jgi:hypothetical protein
MRHPDPPHDSSLVEYLVTNLLPPVQQERLRRAGMGATHNRTWDICPDDRNRATLWPEFCGAWTVLTAQRDSCADAVYPSWHTALVCSSREPMSRVSASATSARVCELPSALAS